MAAPDNVYAFSMEAALEAAERWSHREEHHAKFERAARNKQFSELDTPERCANRANRLLSQMSDVAPAESRSIAAEFEGLMSGEVAGAAVTANTVTDELLERVLGKTRDFQFVEFLEQALYVTRSVGRVVTALDRGRVSYGTGFMVSPRLLLTNHHVLPSADDAARSRIEFNYQRDRLGQPVKIVTFKLDPATFFLNDKEHDFALVAVAAERSVLANFGYCPLIKEMGKIVAGEPINIIQHPKGELKQVVIRENRLIDALDGADLFLHYEADTEPGSSGSPVFNDQWEVVALHHSGVPKKNSRGELIDVDGQPWKKGGDVSRLEWVANEGVRASKLAAFLARAKVKPAEKPLLRELLDAAPPTGERLLPEEARNKGREPAGIDDTLSSHSRDRSMNREQKSTAASVTLTIPLNITFSLGDLGSVTLSSPTPSSEDFTEKILPDPDYDNRPGYDPEFLGFTAPFPKLTNVAQAKAFALPGVTGSERFVLKYHHYSILFNKDRQLAFVAGVNYDPTAETFQREGNDKWFYDPRVPESLQAGNDLYAGNPLDRGHLVRRADCAWGDSQASAKIANDDTFHFTNCSPQHEITNQGKVQQAPPGLRLWGKLEEHIASQGKSEQRKISVFNGPVFRTNDKVYRGVKIPKEFWKLVVFANDAGESSATAFVLTQAALIQGLEEEFEVGQYATVQIRIKDLETKTSLNFGPFRDWDLLEQEGAEESFSGDVPAVVLKSLQDMVL